MITLKFNEHRIPAGCEPTPGSEPMWFTLYEAGEWHHISQFNPELGFHSLRYAGGDIYDARLKAEGYSPWRK